MPIRKDFLHPEPPQITRFQIITGLFIIVLYAFAWYSVLYLTREILRMNSVTYDNNLWVLTDAEVSFYNLFFAFIAVILGQSACLIYWFDRPKRIFGQIRRRTSIINDQRVLNWYFMSWFSKLGFVFVFLYACSFDDYGFFSLIDEKLLYNSFWGEIDFYPNYSYIYILIIIVLFLQLWTTIRRVYKRKSLKWMLVSMALLSISAFGLSKINLIDYKKINERILKENMYYTHGIELPELIKSEEKNRKLYQPTLYVAPGKSSDDKPIVIIETTEIKVENISQILERERTPHSFNWSCNLSIDRRIKMKFVQEIYRELAEASMFKCDFTIAQPHRIHDKVYNQNGVFSARIPLHCSSVMTTEDIFKMLNNEKVSIIEIKPTASACFIDDVLMPYPKIQNTVYQKILENNPNYVIKLYVKDEMDVEAYLKIQSAIREGLKRHKKEYAIKVFSKEYDRLMIEEKKEIARKYPYAVVEITEDMATDFE